MTTDLYTKAVLTVIAACLLYLCISGPSVLATVQAEQPQTEVVIVGWKPDPRQAGVTRLGNQGVPVHEVNK